MTSASPTLENSTLPGSLNHGQSISPGQERKFFEADRTFSPNVADKTVSFPAVLKSPRLKQIVWLTLRFVFAWLAEILTTRKVSASKKVQNAYRLRKLFEDLGPTFIKIGQFLSFRADILPEEFVCELKLLQDQVPAFNFQLARQTIERDLGSPIESLFSSFEELPLASASLGQVHRAQLFDGRVVAIKVQRPDLKALFYEDLGYLRMFARLMQFFGQGKHAQFLFDLSLEFGNMLFAEIDYIREGRNADKLRRLLRLNPRIKVPRVIWKYTGYHVLTTQYLPGIKIDQISQLEAAKVNLKDLARLLMECFLEQILYAGFFHADPHAGNMAVDSDGGLILYDFGMMGTISAREKKALLATAIAIAKEDSQLLAQSLIDLQIINSAVCRETIINLLEPLITCYQGQDLTKQDLNLDMASLEADIDRLIKNNAFNLPPNLAYLMRAGTALEGVVRTIKPNFNFAKSIEPYLLRWANNLIRQKNVQETSSQYTFAPANL